MTPPHACPEQYEALIALVLGELDAPARAALEQHLLVCDGCRSARDALAVEERLVRAAFDPRVHRGPVLPPAGRDRAFVSPPRPRAQALERPPLWKGVKAMMLKHPRFSVAALLVLIIGAGWLVYLPWSGASSAYAALEETAQATLKVKNYHVKITPAGAGVGEMWAQMDEQGNLLHMRMDFPASEDGPKVTWWERGKAKVWFKAKNFLLTVSEPNLLQHFQQLRALLDPRLVIENLEAAQKKGQAQVEIQTPSNPDEPTRIMVQNTSEPNRRRTYLINPRTKLVDQVLESRRNADGQWDQAATSQYDYDQPIAAEIWEPQLPADVLKVDQTTQEVGLAKGDLTDNEIAVKVARTLFEALIAKDYALAGRLLEGVPASAVQENLGPMQFRRVVDVGAPTPHPNPRTRFLQVPVTVEFSPDGHQVQTKTFTLNIRPVYNNLQRWVVGGGL